MSTGGKSWREKDLNARARAAQDGITTHIRLGSSWLRDDPATAGETITLVGLARELHGTQCTDCPPTTTPPGSTA
jgi:hypothetical protein